ncbi:MAG: hypothetical protein LH606_01705 [Cytophagaceae bacterium]|nr:hypothetical protein [Cytophagaceae bacterium]
MNRVLLLASLLTGFAGNALAQNTLREPIKEFGVPRRSQVQIALPNRNRLIVVFNNWPELAANRNLDSLLRLFVGDLRLWRDSTGTRTDARRVLYSLDPQGQRTVRVTAFPAPTETYQFRNGEEPVQLKTMQDTLVIEKRLEPASRTTKPAFELPLNLRFYFLLNRVEDIETIARQGLNGEIDKAIQEARAYTSHDLFQPRYRSTYTPDPVLRHRWRVGGFNELSLGISPGVGVGVVRNQLYTALIGDLALFPGIGRLGARLGWHEYFFFQNQPDGPSRIVRNSFLNAGILFFKPWDKTHNRVNMGGVTLGYLIRRNGDYFEKATFRLAGTVNIFKWSKIEPELYWHGAFKKVYPGVRVNVGF